MVDEPVGRDGVIPMDKIPLWYLQQVTGFLKMSMNVTNNGHHYQFRRDRLLLEWWPSSGRAVANKNFYGERLLCRTLRELRVWLTTQTELAATRRRRGFHGK